MATELNGYRKIYRLRVAQLGAKSIEVTFPYEVVDREARKHGLNIHEFLKQFHVVAEFDNFEGVHYTFKEMPESITNPPKNGNEVNDA